MNGVDMPWARKPNMRKMTDEMTRRISVVLHSTGSDRQLLELLSTLAAQPRSSILGLFLEDVNLLRLGEMPSARELCRVTYSERRLDTGDIQRQLRVRARTARRALEATALAAGAPWAFRTARGTLGALLQEALRDCDLLILGQPPRLLPSPVDLALVSLSRQAAGPVLTVFDGSPPAERALALAAGLAAPRSHRLIVYLVAGSEPERSQLREQLDARLGDTAAEVRPARPSEVQSLLEATRREAASLLILGDSPALWEPDTIRALEQRLNCPAVVVR
jgi:nucleotide-binding universal stress UspA family protein